MVRPFKIEWNAFLYITQVNFTCTKGNLISGREIVVSALYSVHYLIIQNRAIIQLKYIYIGTALEALTSMQSFLRGRPSTFKSLENAIEWRSVQKYFY